MISSILSWLGKVPGIAWLIGAGVVAGGLWLHQHDARVRADVKAEVMIDSVRALMMAVNRLNSAVESKDSAVSRQTVELVHEQQRHAVAETVLRRRTDSVVTDFRKTLTAQQQKGFDALVTGYDARLAEKDSMFAAQVRLTHLAEERVLVRDIAIAKLNETNQTLLEQWEHERKIHRGLAKKVIEYIPVIGATVLACVTIAPC